jgi:hypothetical protein
MGGWCMSYSYMDKTQLFRTWRRVDLYTRINVSRALLTCFIVICSCSFHTQSSQRRLPWRLRQKTAAKRCKQRNNSMEQSPFWEANMFSDAQEIRRVLWKPKFHNCILRLRHQFWDTDDWFVTSNFLVWGIVSTSTNPLSGWQTLVDCPWLRI